MRLQLKLFPAPCAVAVDRIIPAMDARVILVRENLQVLYAIIRAVTIPVVNDLTLPKETS
jgi:hypothetical protein